jgi:hypothetical protein
MPTLTQTSVVKINKDILNVNLTPYREYLSWNTAAEKWFVEETQYKLLNFVAKQIALFPHIIETSPYIADLGTLYGASALALGADNPHSYIRTYDIINHIPAGELSCKDLGNIAVVHADCLLHINEFTDADLIHLDIDPHDGIQEQRLLDLLIRNDFKGLLICDDIHLSASMESFWDRINLKKFDITHLGHWSGTGIVVFNDKVLDVEIEK